MAPAEAFIGEIPVPLDTSRSIDRENWAPTQNCQADLYPTAQYTCPISAMELGLVVAWYSDN
jgi:hypothetical protein